MRIPFLDLKAVNARYEPAFQRRFQDFLAGGTYILGDAVTQFENEFASYCGTAYCMGTGNGLDALRLIFEGYKSLGKLKVGDGVLLAANSYIATVLAVIHAGLKPVFAEVEDKTFNLDLGKLAEPDASVKAILVTHLYGQLGPVEPLSAYAKKHQLLFIEDASQAHGAVLNGKKAGSFGDAAAFSFYPTKNLGALGDAGAVITSEASLAVVIDRLRNYGRVNTHETKYAGFNSRLDSLQALFLSEKLKDLDAANSTRRSIAQRYLAAITNPLLKLPHCNKPEAHVFYVFVIQVPNRDNFLAYLDNADIGYAIHYKKVAYQQQALSEFNALHFPVAEAIAESCVSIPLNPALTHAEVGEIIAVLNQYHA